jgi:hypothetical protein
MDELPKPYEIREIDGKQMMWIPGPEPAPLEAVKIAPPITTIATPKVNRTTKVISQGNYTISAGQYSPIDILGKGIIREAAVITDQKISVQPKMDGVDILNGINSFDSLVSISQYSSTVNVIYDAPNYIVTIGKLRFNESFELVIWPAVTTNVISVTCTYDICEGI